MWFLFKILHVRGRNTCLCQGEFCFIMLGEVFTSFVVIGASFSFLYTGLVIILLHTFYFIFIYMMMMHVFFSYLYMCCFFPIFIHMFRYVHNIYFCFTHDALMSFCLSVSERQVVKVYLTMNYLLTKFFKSLQQGQIYFVIQQVVMTELSDLRPLMIICFVVVFVTDCQMG